jgi:hypothetical protein
LELKGKSTKREEDQSIYTNTYHEDKIIELNTVEGGEEGIKE